MPEEKKVDTMGDDTEVLDYEPANQKPDDDKVRHPF